MSAGRARPGELKLLVGHREDLVAERTRVQNELEAELDHRVTTVCPRLRACLGAGR